MIRLGRSRRKQAIQHSTLFLKLDLMKYFLPGRSRPLQLGQFLSHRETNLRYLALESMCLLATSEFSHEAVKKHQETVINALKTERDVSVRQRAVDLLYAMCDRTNSEDIVLEMLTYLEARMHGMNSLHDSRDRDTDKSHFFGYYDL